MPYEVELSVQLRRAGWKAKIFDVEGPEIPHVSILFRGSVRWRVSLRDGGFVVPPGGSWNEVPLGVRQAIENDWERLIEEWDARFPHNPIESEDDEQNDG